jgi:hypothetical protein
MANYIYKSKDKPRIDLKLILSVVLENLVILLVFILLIYFYQ